MVKVAVERFEPAWKVVFRAIYEVPKERCMEFWKEEREMLKYMYIGRKMNH